MSRARTSALCCVCFAATLAPASALTSKEIPTRPIGAVRSLHHIQDQIARGDATAFQVQPGTLRIVDEILAGLGSDDFAKPEQSHAALAYAVTGGNPATFARLYEAVARETGDETERAVADAVAAALLRRRVSDDPRADPLAIGGMLGAGLALLNGINADDAVARTDQFRKAVLLAPGTLVEESALRRLMPLHAENGDHDAFLTAASRYARTFVVSPYASDFAAALVKGGVALSRADEFERLAQIIGFMPEAHRRSIIARQMRAAAVAGNFELVRFLEARFTAEIEAGEVAETADASVLDPGGAVRQRLYALMANIAGAEHAAVASELDAIDAAALPLADRHLLEVARAVVRDMTRRGDGDGIEAVQAEPATQAAQQSDAMPVQGDVEAFDLPMQPDAETIRTILPGYGAAAEPVDRQPVQPAGARPAIVRANANGAPETQATVDGLTAEHRDFVSNARDMLRDIDSVLEEQAR